MSIRAQHLIAEYKGCARAALTEGPHIEALLRRAADAAGATVIGVMLHAFEPEGVTGVVLLAESHIAVHTWPERGYAAVDFFTCGACLPERAHEVLWQGLRARSAELLCLERGEPERPRSIAQRYHHVAHVEDSARSEATE